MKRRPVITSLLGVVCLGLLGVATNIATGVLPDQVAKYAWLAWPVIGLLLAAMAVMELRRDPDGSSRSAGGAAARTMLLNQVELYWVKGVLDRSLYREARIELGFDKTVNPDLHPWDIVVAAPDATPTVAPAGTSMRDLFTDFGGAMVILGAPGAGKTTMLLELLRELVAAARRDPAAPLPIVVNLASWAVHRRSIADWLAEEVATRYQIAARHTLAWTEAENIALLLDGLDEVAQGHRNACIAAINDFHREYAVPLVVSCRLADYERLDSQLRLYGTATIRPLTRDQVEDFLARTSEATAGLRRALANDPDLRGTMESPLMLSVGVLAYHHATAEPPEEARPPMSTRDRLWTTYLRSMLARRPDPRYPPAQTVRTLGTIARRLHRDGLTIFTVDSLALDWLPPRHYPALFKVTQIGYALGTSMLVVGGLGALLLGPAGLALAAVYSAGVAIFVYGVASESGGSFLSDISDEVRRQQRAEPAPPRPHGWRTLVDGLRYSFGSIFGEGVLGLLVLAIPGALVGAAYLYLTDLWLSVAAAVATFVAVLLCFVVAEATDNLTASTPNARGRHRFEVPSPALLTRIRIGATAAPLGGAVVGTVAGLIVAWPGSAADGVRFGIVVGAGVALFIASIYLFGLNLAEQLLLRLLLARSGTVPWPCRPLLDHAAQALLLRRTGDDYLFIHRELLEFLARLPVDAEVPPQRSAVGEPGSAPPAPTGARLP